MSGLLIVYAPPSTATATEIQITVIETFPEIKVERRSSTDEGNINNTNATSFVKEQGSPRTTNSLPSSPNHGISPATPTTTSGTAGIKRGAGAIGIKKVDVNSGGLTDTVVYPDGRRRSSLFGYSTNAADDYMQKDLLSSSWS
ncbi:unnamed protein product [Absidia cylindrospora]